MSPNSSKPLGGAAGLAITALVSFVAMSQSWADDSSGAPTAIAIAGCAERDDATSKPRRLPLDWLNLRNWSRGSAPVITLQAPPSTIDPTIPIHMQSHMKGAVRYAIDVDLNHDGRFTEAGELAYGEGMFPCGENEGVVRLHGLIEGSYALRARVTFADGREFASVVQQMTILPPPSSLPVSFEPNVGQADPAVLFLGRARGHIVFVTADETVLVGRRAKGQSVQRFRLAGANSWARPTGEKKLPGISNYFIGNDPEKWRTDIPTYQAVITHGVYPGIDLVYHSKQRQLEYDFRVTPGADPSAIVLDFPDVDRLSIDEDGVLILHLPDGERLRKSAPVMYQGSPERADAVMGIGFSKVAGKPGTPSAATTSGAS